MKPKKEYRVNIKGSYQGHYVLAENKERAIAEVRNNLPLTKGEPLEVHLWKTTPKGSFYPSKLTPYARRKMTGKVRSVS